MIKINDFAEEKHIEKHTFPKTNWANICSKPNQSSFQNKVIIVQCVHYSNRKNRCWNSYQYISIDWSVIELFWCLQTHTTLFVCLFNIYMSNRWFFCSLLYYTVLCSRYVCHLCLSIFQHECIIAPWLYTHFTRLQKKWKRKCSKNRLLMDLFIEFLNSKRITYIVYVYLHETHIEHVWFFWNIFDCSAFYSSSYIYISFSLVVLLFFYLSITVTFY